MKLSHGLLVTFSFVALVACGSGGGSTDGGGGSGATGGGTGGNGATGGGTGGSGATGGGTGATGGTGGSAPGTCHTGADCDGFAFCAAYTLAPLCNGQPDFTFDENCATDADCVNAGENQIC